MESQLEPTKNTQIDLEERKITKENDVEESTKENEEKKAEEIKAEEKDSEQKEPEQKESEQKEPEQKEPEEKEPEEREAEEKEAEEKESEQKESEEEKEPKEKQNKNRPTRITKKKSPAKTRGPYITKNDEKVAAMINLIKQEPNLSIRAAARRVKLAESTAIRKMDKWNKMRELGEEEHFFSKKEKKPAKLGVHHS